MQVQRKDISDTETVLTISASEAYLNPIKQTTLEHLSKHISVAGFREGKAPLSLIEKNVDPQKLQTEFLDQAVNALYSNAVKDNKLRPVANPQIELKKFVPFSQIEFEAKVQIIGNIKLPDYKKIRKTKAQVKIGEKEIADVLKNLQTRLADKKEVDRASKKGDEIWIDFNGKNEKGEPVSGADGKDYPLILGSNTFIPGFEDNLIGTKKGDVKSFTLTFPKEYGVATLQGKKVTFDCKIKKVEEREEPKIDDNLAKKAGPFQTLEALKEDIKKQLQIERNKENDRNFENDLVKEIVQKSTIAIPQALVNEQTEKLLQDLRQNLAYRGQTYEEYLKMIGKTEEEYKKEVLTPDAKERVKAGLVLSEISEKEDIELTPEEVEIRIQVLKGQYKDEAMQKELDKPENRRDVAARLLTEKTINKLVEYATS